MAALKLMVSVILEKANTSLVAHPVCTEVRKVHAQLTSLSQAESLEKSLSTSFKCLTTWMLFPRVPGGLVSILIIDGHESQLTPMFLTYINDDNHIWKVCFVLSYAISYW
jgi:hypothetical protein